ncbi:Zn(II)2Cys6 transcription factor [Aspergillus stella-maris]|uniref:Zn(II)2Cys6 transcription factor n=1 Tax=Aspergillus stella-maris TaxID=1810926 RepID=UPI003CCCCFC3
MRSSIQRKRLACAECTRKKIKCDKVVPCRNCTRRGAACYRLPVTPTTGPPTLASDENKTNDPAFERDISGRIQELQATLKAAREGKPSTPNNNNDTASLFQSPSPALLSARGSSDPGQSSLANASSRSTRSCTDATEVEDAATILEFLAWGRRKGQSFGTSDTAPAQCPGDVAFDDGLNHEESSHLRLSEDSSSLAIVQLLLPEPRTTQQIVRYHCDCLLWYHASFHSLVFQNELNIFVHRHGGHLDRAGVNLQWVALLFAILAGSITCAPPAVAYSWGFRNQERCTIAQRWFKAALVCLNRADYTSNHSIYAVECIATMTISAHMLGHSNSHSVMLATAVRIAQSLGLHMLGSAADDKPDMAIQRETGRRLWTELCIQDWFSIAFSESYLIHLLDFTTDKPINCRDDTMSFLAEEVPTSIGYHRLLYDVARLMPQLQDDLVQSNTLYTKYEHVLKYDTQMRALASKHVPLWLRDTPIDPSWPCYVPWARHCLTISSAHKIIMIHRKFLWPSFTNPAFAFTRRTCIAASKTIIRECKRVSEEEGPTLWIYHAFSVAASIILCLDILFRPPSDAENQSHRELIQDTLAILLRGETSMIAKRGVTILRLLCRVEQSRGLPQKSHEAIQEQPMWPDEQRYASDVRKLVQAAYDREATVNNHIHSPYAGERGNEATHNGFAPNFPDMTTESVGQDYRLDVHETLGDLLGPQSRFDVPDPLEEILFLAQSRSQRNG